MAHKKGVGSSKNGRDSESSARRQTFGANRQRRRSSSARRNRHPPGRQRGLGLDHTLFALNDGVVIIDRMGKDRKRVSVLAAS